MTIRAAVVLSVLLLASGRAGAQTHEQKLILSVGGGPPASRTITIELLDSGDFRASGTGLPFTDAGLTKFTKHRDIGKLSSARVFVLARQAGAEWRGTSETWPDCKWATLEIRGGTYQVSTASGCSSGVWLSRPTIKEFLGALDRLLPPGWTVNEVLNS
jgi:hypothetical protein